MGKRVLTTITAALTATTLFTVGLTSCGGDDGESGSTSFRGQLTDAPINGVYYETSSGLKGKTREEGYFYYRKGDTVTFKIGKVTLGSVEGQGLVTPIELAKGNSNKIQFLTALFYALDKDSNPENGMDIDEEQLSNLESEIDLSSGNYSLTNLPESFPKDLKTKISSHHTDAIQHFSSSMFGHLKEILGSWNNREILFDGDKPFTCYITINNIDESNREIRVSFSNCEGGEPDTPAFKVENGIIKVVEGDGNEDEVIDLDHEKICLRLHDGGEVCLKPAPEGVSGEHSGGYSEGSSGGYSSGYSGGYSSGYSGGYSNGYSGGYGSG
jgi:hypothetical protein